MSRSGAEPTEEATPERARKARQDGQVAVSRDLSSAVALLALLAVVSAGAASGMARLLALTRAAFVSVSAPAPPAGPTSVLAGMAGRAFDLAFALSLAPLTAALAASVLVAALQTGGLFAWRAARPDIARLSPAAGLGRLFGVKTLIEVGKGLLKVGLVAVVAAATLGPTGRELPRLVGASPPAMSTALGALALRLGLRVALALLALGIIDWLLAQRRHRRALMMTRDEVKREHKDAEGDPHHKAERQRLHRQVGEQRMIEDVRKADFVVVNPDHIAVAVRYDRDSDAAPVVLAKGERLVAERIKQVAREAGVPIYRDIGLARALHEIPEGDEIPEALYETVAELLRALWELERPTPSAPDDDGRTRPGPGPAVNWKRV